MSYEDKKERIYKELSRLWSMHLDRKNFKVSRRDLMKGMAAMGITAGMAKYFMQGAPLGVRKAWAAEGGTPEERAINAAKALFANAKKKTISIMHPSGSGGNMTPFTKEWKDLTGFDVELIEVPVTQTHQKAMQEAVAKTGRFDLMIPAPLSLPELAEAGAALDITDYVAKYDPEDSHGDNQLEFPVREFGQKYKGRYYGLYCDGDVWHLSYRIDKMKEKGKAPFAQGLMVDTWDDYDKLCGEMHDKANNFYGALEYRSPFWNKFHWMTRFQSKGVLYFDKDMNSMAASPESIKTCEEMVKLQDVMPTEQFTYGFTENYAQYYAQGRGFCEFGWPSLWRYSMDAKGAKSIVAGRDDKGFPIQSAPSGIPGTKNAAGETIRAVIMPFAWDFVVNKHSEIPEAAYLYSQWLTGPTMSMRSIPNEGGYFDPWRRNHFLAPSPEFFAGYPGDYLKVQFEEMTQAVPEIIMPGAAEYHDAIDKNLQAAYNKQKTPEKAMQDAAKEMDRITKRRGKDKQKESWIALAKMYPEPLQKAAGVASWS